MIDLREIFRKGNTVLPLFLFSYLVLWHLTMIFIGSGFTPARVAGDLIHTCLLYTAATILVSSCAAVFFSLPPGRWVKRLGMAVMIFLFSLSVIIRIIDWGTVYYGGVHINDDFWYHAFYVDSTVFMRLRLSYILYGIAFFLILAFMRILIFQSRASLAGSGEPGMRPLIRKALPAALVSVAAGLATVAVLFVFRSPDPLARDMALLYTAVPEKEFFASFYRSVLAGGGGDKDLPLLDDRLIAKTRKAGVLLNSLTAEYPLMKKSIYLDPSRRNRDIPKIAPGTNIIIIFAESFSRFFLREDVHGLKGIVENVKDLEARSLRIENMYNADFPTINGIIAALSSSLYHVTKIGGEQGVRPPIMGKYLFITDILKRLDYTTVHIQGGSEFFVGMKDFFIKKQGFDQFYGYESLLKKNLSDLKVSFGKSDHDVFTYVKSWLQEYRGKAPFFMSISTVNLHTPYQTTHRHPMSDGNPMLDSLYSFDRAFGIFWNFFKNSKFRENTVVILTADHAIGSNAYISKFRSRFSDQFRSYFDYIPFLVLVPGQEKWHDRTISTTCTNLDIVPTLLDMMNIDLENPFIGLSIFSDRRDYPFCISTQPILDRLTDPERDFVKNLAWSENDQGRIIEFLMACVTRRRIIPENFTVDIKTGRK